MQKAMQNLIFLLILCGVSCKDLKNLLKTNGESEAEPCMGRGILNELRGIADTSIAFVSGDILGNDGPLSGAFISVSGTSQEVFSDAHGKYRIQLSSGQYNITFRYRGCKDFVIKDLVLGTGHMREIQVKFGENNI